MPTPIPIPKEDDEPSGLIVMPHAPGARLPTVPALPTAEAAREKLSKATPDQLDEFLWLLKEAHGRGMTTFAAVGNFINRDAASISKIYRGKYEAGLQQMADHIRHIRETLAEQATIGEEPFVPTLSVVTEIGTFCELARTTRQMTQIFGKNQTGKSSALRYYAETHGDTTYVKLPAGGGTNKTMMALAEAAKVPSRKSDVELWERLRRRFHRSSLIIVDEFHQAVHAGRKVQTVTVDRFREIHDDCGCGIVLCGTEHMRDSFQGTNKHAEFLAQTENRGRLRLYIPTAPTRTDFEAICEAYQLPQPTGEAGIHARKVARENGIAALTDLLAIARRLASKQKEPLTWDSYLVAVATVATYGSDKRPDRKEQL